MIIRKYEPSDCKYLAELFYDTVHTVNAKDYTKKQLDVWADGNADLDEWNRSLAEHYTVIAVENGVIIGFGDMDKTGYLDRLYVHKDYQGKGTATAICNKLENKFDIDLIRTHASVTAKPFFEKRGYRTVREQQVERKGVLLTNYRMVKKRYSTNTPVLETERLFLRKFNYSDMEALYDIFRDEEVNTFLPWFPLRTMEEAKCFFEQKYVETYKQPCGYRYAVCLKTDNIPIGYINLSTDAGYDFGYGLRREYWHKGIITEAGKAVIEQLKKDGIPYITATHDIKNPRSGNVMKKLGMHYQYSYEEQWQPKDIIVTFRMYQLNLNGKNDRIYKEYWDKSDVHFVEPDI